MKHILSHRIVKHLAKDERETRARYVYLGKHYKLPKLIHAGNQEGGHAKIFEGLEKTTKSAFKVWRFPNGKPAPNNYRWNGINWVTPRKGWK